MPAEAPHVPGRVLLALDGHDAAGKSTLARGLARRLGAPVCSPFSGPGGEEMLRLAESGQAARAAEVARGCVARALAGTTEPVVIVDRHWMTVFTLLPEDGRDGWAPLPPTVLCWAGPRATRDRLLARGEGWNDPAWHVHYLRAYRRLARRYGCPVLRTDRMDPEQALEALTGWARSIIDHVPGRLRHLATS